MNNHEELSEDEKILKNYDIDIPRVRGVVFMKNAEKVSDEECKKLYEEGCLCRVEACLTPDSFYTLPTKRMLKYLKYDKSNRFVTEIKWNNIHGKLRKELKFKCKTLKKNLLNSMNTFNKYVGKKDVLCVHNRIGGDNWNFYNLYFKVSSQPWFIEKVDNYFDSTYSDIYVKIKEN